MANRGGVDETVISEFIAKMQACFEERLAVADPADKRAVERRMEGIMRDYHRRNAWDAMVDAEGAAGDVPRGTPLARRRRPRGRTSSGRYSPNFDHKLAQAGDKDDE